MSILQNKFLFKLIATICIFLTLLNFIGSTNVYAADKVWGGTLITPIVYLLTGLGDSIMEIMHKSIQEQGAAIIKIEGSSTAWDGISTILAVVAGIVVAVVAILAIVYTGGLAGYAAAALVRSFCNVYSIGFSWSGFSRSCSRYLCWSGN